MNLHKLISLHKINNSEKKMKKLIPICFSILILASCSGIKVINVNQAEKISKNHFVYALPKNIIAIDIEITESRFFRGPYYDYAENLLGIKGVQKADKIDYFISGSEISVYAEPDSNQFYFIFPKCKNYIHNLSLSDNNILLSINKNSAAEIKSIPELKNFDTKPFPTNLFTTLSMNEYLKEHIDTVWKQVKVDTNWTRVPVTKKVVEAASFEDKAKEAAHHIMRIRKRLFKLVSGAYEKAPKIKSLDIVINQLKSEEEEYLSLFIGKSFTRKTQYTYLYNPKKQTAANKEIIAYLNPEKGITAEKSVKTLPIYIELVRSNQLSQLDSAFMKIKKASKNNGIAYRIPEMTKIKLSLGNTLMTEKQIPIAQFGKINNLDPKFLNKKRSVEFDPFTGNIKNIE